MTHQFALAPSRFLSVEPLANVQAGRPDVSAEKRGGGSRERGAASGGADSGWEHGVGSCVVCMSRACVEWSMVQSCECYISKQAGLVRECIPIVPISEWVGVRHNRSAIAGHRFTVRHDREHNVLIGADEPNPTGNSAKRIVLAVDRGVNEPLHITLQLPLLSSHKYSTRM